VVAIPRTGLFFHTARCSGHYIDMQCCRPFSVRWKIPEDLESRHSDPCRCHHFNSRFDEGKSLFAAILNAIVDTSPKAVKILGFTPKVTEILQGLRVKELKLSTLFRRLLCATSFFVGVMGGLAPFVTFLVFVLIQSYTHMELTAATAFTALSLIGMLAQPLNALLRTIPVLKSALACFERIQTFLESPSRQPHVLPLNSSLKIDGPEFKGELDVKASPLDRVTDQGIELGIVDPRGGHFSGTTLMHVHNASFAWTADGPPVVKAVNFSVARGNFVFVIGPVGCGKSTLLKGLMGETPSSKGLVNWSTSKSSFVDQTPWIQNDSIRKNIIGPSILDEAWYEEVVRACALNHDLAALPDSHGALSLPLSKF
jgi:ATP-binding cassette subfamily C (CFTR/MRP) protein 1